MPDGKQRENYYGSTKNVQTVVFALCDVQENLSVLAVQSVYDASMPHPCKEVVRGEILPSAWILEPDVVNGRDITRVIYMAQVRFSVCPTVNAKSCSVTDLLRAGK